MTQSILKKYGMYVLFIVIWLYLRKRDLPYTFQHSSDVYFLSFLGLLIFGRYIGNLGKYKSPHFSSDGVHGSCSIPPFTVKYWSVFRLGGVKHFPLPFIRGSEATVIIYKKSWEKVGDNYVTTSRCKPIAKTNIPYYLMSYLERENYPLDNVYIGYCSRKLETEDPDVIQIEEQVDELQSVIDTYRDTTKGKFEVIEGTIKGVERMGKSIRRKKGFKIIHRDRDDDEE